jgi:hypothetical protein
MHLRDTAVIPPHLAKLMSPADRKSIGAGAELPSESAAKSERREERKLHAQFSQWCLRLEIEVIHGRMDKKSALPVGWPDFTCMKGTKFCLVEFKAPGGKLSEVQTQVITRLQNKSIPVLVAYSVKDAIDFCREVL